MRLIAATRLAAAGATALLLAAAGAAPAAAEAAQVDGFRSARFDMTEDQVRLAIAADFRIPAAQIVKQINKIERTTILSIKVQDLLPESGGALVHYKFGFKSRKLVQVDVIWGGPADAKVTAAALTAIIINMRQYLQDRGFPKDKVVMNATTPQPNIVLLFRGEDQKGRVVALLGQFKFDPKAEAGKQLHSEEPQAVRLSYILDHKAPDIFKIEKGKF